MKTLKDRKQELKSQEPKSDITTEYARCNHKIWSARMGEVRRFETLIQGLILTPRELELVEGNVYFTSINQEDYDNALEKIKKFNFLLKDSKVPTMKGNSEQ